MRKVLIVMESLGGGGAEKVLLNILKKLDKNKYTIDLFLFNKQGIYLEEIKSYLNNIDGMAPRNKKYDKYLILRKINSLFLKAKNWLFINGYIYKIKDIYDIEIAFLDGRPTTYINKRKSKTKKIAWIHTDLMKQKQKNENYKVKNYMNIDRIICVSKDSKESFLTLYPNFKEKTKVIYNLIPKDEIIDKSEEIILKNKKITIVTVGRLDTPKGYDILLKAHKKLINEGLDYNLKILGEGPLQKEFENYISDNKLWKNTELLGFKKNPYPYIKNADIYIMSSRYEGFPLVLCEAIILKKAIIATKCTGPLEILENGKYGKLIEMENIAELACAMKKFIMNKDLIKKYEELSKQRSSFFEETKVLKEIEELLDEK